MRKCYYLADDIYPAWSTVVKMFSVARDEKTLKFKRVQEAARKDIERAFRVLQGRWGIIRQPACTYQNQLVKRNHVLLLLMLHNIVIGRRDLSYTIRVDVHVLSKPQIERNWVERCELHLRKSKELRDRKMHIDLRQDLVEHLWNNHWFWSLEGSGEFSVASIRRFIDDQRLLTVDSKTLGLYSVPLREYSSLKNQFGSASYEIQYFLDKLRAKSVISGMSNIRSFNSFTDMDQWIEPLYNCLQSKVKMDDQRCPFLWFGGFCGLIETTSDSRR
ncbi:ALP1-like protein isoform X1 [Tanacetum coccineum]